MLGAMVNQTESLLVYGGWVGLRLRLVLHGNAANCYPLDVLTRNKCPKFSCKFTQFLKGGNLFKNLTILD